MDTARLLKMQFEGGFRDLLGVHVHGAFAQFPETVPLGLKLRVLTGFLATEPVVRVLGLSCLCGNRTWKGPGVLVASRERGHFRQLLSDRCAARRKGLPGPQGRAS